MANTQIVFVKYLICFNEKERQKTNFCIDQFTMSNGHKKWEKKNCFNVTLYVEITLKQINEKTKYNRKRIQRETNRIKNKWKNMKYCNGLHTPSCLQISVWCSNRCVTFYSINHTTTWRGLFVVFRCVRFSRKKERKKKQIKYATHRK